MTKVGGGTLELGGNSSNSYQGNTFLNEGKLLLNKQDIGLNETQTLAFGGGGSGTVNLSFNGTSATSSLSITDEVQTITLGGTSGGTFTPSFGGVAATFPITFQSGNNPQASFLQTQLETIPALTGNVSVSGNNGGPFTITFNNKLTGQNVAQLANATNPTGGTTITYGTQTNGNALTAAQVQTNLNTIPGINGNITVSLAAGTVNGGPYVITFQNGTTGTGAGECAADHGPGRTEHADHAGDDGRWQRRPAAAVPGQRHGHRAAGRQQCQQPNLGWDGLYRQRSGRQ